MPDRRRRIAFVTAARSEYDLLAPVARACSGRPELTVGFVVGGAHLSPFHGMGLKHIEADGFPIFATIESLLSSESWPGRALSFAQLTEGLTRVLAADRPDVLFVAGDREEALAGALVGCFLGIHVAHSHGGDRCIASDIDEVFRPAISKLAHLHFTATEAHRERLIRMGELAENVFAVGAAGLDRLRDEIDVPAEELSAELGVDVTKPFFLVIQHPSPTLGVELAGREMAELLDGVLALGAPVFCSYPNFDPGNIAIRAAIDERRARTSLLRTYHNLPRRTFVALYRRAAAIVGNSSSLIVESGFLRVPAILVGPRQDLRDRGPNVLRVEAEAAAVSAACRRALEDETFRAIVRTAPSLYGDGHTGPRIAEILARHPLDPALLRKTMPY
jgi:UDP-hydrolysing UDP-N-acetyl-D-glucosamine 2-epimerase